MPRGGKREKAGRKTGWVSGVTFEETVVIRVPKAISKQLLEIAHRLDAGEEIDLVSNSKNTIEHVNQLELQNEELVTQVENLRIELDTKSKVLRDEINLLRHENTLLLQKLDPRNLQCDLVTNSKKQDNEIVTKSEKHEQFQLLDLEDTNSKAQKLKSLTAAELSRRFGKEDGFVKRKKNYYKNRISEFNLLLKDSDPDKIAWEYSEQDRKYHPSLQNYLNT